MKVITFQEHIRHISLVFALFLALASCSNTTKVQTFRVSGKVNLDWEDSGSGNSINDLSGVKVSLYEQIHCDSLTAHASDLYPFIGAVDGQDICFDSTGHSPIATTPTKADGTYELSGVEAGIYNILFSKSGWGDVYLYALQITGDASIGETTMFQIVEVPSMVGTEYIFRHNHTYTIGASTMFLDKCTFEGGSQIRISPNANVDFLGEVQFSGDNAFTQFIENQTESAHNYNWEGLKFVHDNIVIEKVLVRGATTGISLMGPNSTIRNSVFEQLTNGVYAPSDYSLIEYCTFRDISARAVAYNQTIGSDTIKHGIKYSLFVNCNEGLRTLGQPVSITDNVFMGNGIAIVSFSGYHVIEHNLFDLNDTAIMIQGCTITIQQNDFNDNMYSNKLLPAYYTTSSVPVFRDNNFYQSSNYAIYISPHPLPRDIDATLNYWKHQDVSMILYDRYDNPQITAAINYIPQRNTPISTAGVRTKGRRG